MALFRAKKNRKKKKKKKKKKKNSATTRIYVDGKGTFFR